jgi:hypothetical protein
MNFAGLGFLHNQNHFGHIELSSPLHVDVLSPTYRGKMGRVRTKVSLAMLHPITILQIIGDTDRGLSDRQEVGQSHHRTLLPQTHPRLRDQQAHLR